MLRHVAAALGLAALMAVPAFAAEQELTPSDNGQIEFATPSGNIGCLFTPKGGTDVYEPKGGGPELICERVEPAYVTVILGPEGEPEMIEDPGEQSCCGSENILEYGNSVDLEDTFTCAVETTGLTCERDDGVGFSMARAGIELITGEDAADEPEDADDETDAGDEEADDQDAGDDEDE